MSKYQILKSKGFKTGFKKLSKEDKKLTLDIIKRLANDEVLELILKTTHCNEFKRLQRLSYQK